MHTRSRCAIHCVAVSVVVVLTHIDPVHAATYPLQNGPIKATVIEALCPEDSSYPSETIEALS